MSAAHQAAVIERLKRLEGQVRGVERMVGEGRYCIDILTQIAAIRGALVEVERLLLRTHLERCVANAMRSPSPAERARVIRELIDALSREL